MAKKMKRILALLLALTLCAGQLTVAVRANDGTTTKPVENGTETTTVVIDTTTGTTTTTTTTETKDPVTGAETTKTEVEKTDSNNEVIHDSTKTDTTTVSGGGTQTNIDSEWESTDVEKDYDQQVNGNTTVTTDTDITTEVKGEENQQQTVTHDPGSNTETITVNGSGKESTTITGTTTTTTEEEGVKLGEDTKDEEPDTKELDKTDTTVGNYITNNDETNNPWVNGTPVEGTASDPTTVPGSTTTTDVTPENPYNVTLNMTAGGAEVQVKKEITLKDVSDGKFTLPTGKESNVTKLPDGSFKVTDTDGSYYIIAENKTGNAVTGWTITHNPVESAAPTISTNPDKEEGTITSDTGWQTRTETTTYIDQAPTKQTGKVTNADGSTTETIIQKIYNPDNTFKGYKIIEVTVAKSDNANNPTVTTSNRDNYPDESDLKTNFTLPTNVPAPGTTQNPDGTQTVTTVEDLFENGQHRGYIVKKVTTSPDGTYFYTETENLYGTDSVEVIDITKDPTTEEITTTTTTTTTNITEIIISESLLTEERTQEREVTYDTTILTDQDIYQLVETDDGMYFLYEGKMYEVKALSGHGDVTMSSIKPHSSVIDLTPSVDGAIDETTDLRNPHYNDYTDANVEYDKDGNIIITDSYDYKYVGYGLESSITADTGSSNGNGTLVHQFKLVDKNGNTFYALCADFSTSAERGADYSMENVWDADYFNKENAKKISAIVTSGYWGTASGIGSLEEVIKFLKANSSLDDSLLEGLTPGEALTATQAAIWYYGNSGTSEVLTSTDATGYQYTGNKSNGNWTFKDASTNETKRINALYQALINQDVSNASLTDNSTELLGKDNFATEAKLVIKEKATDESGKEKTDAKGNELYLTDLTFRVEVKESDLTGNLVITITDENGKKLHTEQLETSESNWIGRTLADGTAGGDYTIHDLELPAGVKINLNLTGTQTLEEGVYLYSAELYSTSQTFVGIGSGSQNVDLSVDLEFDVEDPKVEHVSKQLKQTREDTVVGKKVDTRSFTKDATQTLTSGDVKTDVHHDIDIYGTVTTKSVKTDITKRSRNWEFFYEYVLELTTVEDTDEEENGGNLFNILDEEVPLADAPKTGDISGIWAAMSLISLGGMLMLTKKKKED